MISESEKLHDELLEANGIIKQLIDAVESGNRLRIEAAMYRAGEYMDGDTAHNMSGDEAADLWGYDGDHVW